MNPDKKLDQDDFVLGIETMQREYEKLEGEISARGVRVPARPILGAQDLMQTHSTLEAALTHLRAYHGEVMARSQVILAWGAPVGVSEKTITEQCLQFKKAQAEKPDASKAPTTSPIDPASLTGKSAECFKAKLAQN